MHDLKIPLSRKVKYWSTPRNAKWKSHQPMNLKVIPCLLNWRCLDEWATIPENYFGLRLHFFFSMSNHARFWNVFFERAIIQGEFNNNIFPPGDGGRPVRSGVEEQKDERVDCRVGHNCHPNYCLKLFPKYCLKSFPSYCLKFFPNYCLKFFPNHCVKLFPACRHPDRSAFRHNQPNFDGKLFGQPNKWKLVWVEGT